MCTMLLALSVAAAPNALQPRALTAGQMVDNINTITKLSSELQPIAQSIHTLPIGKRQTSQWQILITGFKGIIKTATDDVRAMKGTQPYGDDEAELVCEAFREFVIVHQELLNIVIGKSGLLQGLFLGPVAAVLRAVESVVDTLAFGIINSVPGCRARAKQDKGALDKTLKKAVCAFTPGGSLGVGVFC